MESFFRFKHFAISHHQSSMKVGTDALLLGAWLSIPLQCKRILDVGTGSGVIALMLAQRSLARIDAIDIHEASVQEAGQNFTHSPWENQLTAIHSSLQDHQPENGRKYDLIVSNPPFFSNSLLPQSPQHTIAKHDVNLGIRDFVIHSARLLNQDGTWAVILPLDRMEELLASAMELDFFLTHRLNIYPKPDKVISRVVGIFSKNNPAIPKNENLVIRNEAGAFTESYKKLTQDYHAAGYL